MDIDDNEVMRSSPPPNIKRESEERNKPISPIDPAEPDDARADMEVSQKKTQMGTKYFAECKRSMKLCME